MDDARAAAERILGIEFGLYCRVLGELPKEGTPLYGRRFRVSEEREE